jgi:hypothetical protein
MWQSMQLSCGDRPVRVVAGDAPQPPRPVAALEAVALVHLLDLADGPRALPRLRGADEHRQEQPQRQAGAEVVLAAAAAQDAGGADQVTLLADGVAQRRLQAAGVDDGAVPLLLLAAGDVQRPRAVAALAADGVPLEDRFRVAIQRALDVVGAVGVTEQAVGQDGPSRPQRLARARRQVPHLLLGIPADRRHEQVAVAVGQVRVAAGAGADHVLNGPFQLGDGAAVRPQAGAPLPGPVAVAADPELRAEGLERVVVPRVLRGGRRPGRGHQRAAHRVPGVGPGDVGVALGAAVVGDVGDGGIDVPQRADVLAPRVAAPEGGRRKDEG